MEIVQESFPIPHLTQQPDPESNYGCPYVSQYKQTPASKYLSLTPLPETPVFAECPNNPTLPTPGGGEWQLRTRCGAANPPWKFSFSSVTLKRLYDRSVTQFFHL